METDACTIEATIPNNDTCVLENQIWKAIRVVTTMANTRFVHSCRAMATVEEIEHAIPRLNLEDFRVTDMTHHVLRDFSVTNFHLHIPAGKEVMDLEARVAHTLSLPRKHVDVEPLNLRCDMECDCDIAYITQEHVLKALQQLGVQLCPPLDVVPNFIRIASRSGG